MKQIFDMLAALFAIIIFSPIILICMLLIWLNDGHSPFYIANRSGKNNKQFKIYKLRSMRINDGKVASTSADDNRITKVGHFIRRYKIDEISQLFNVIMGDMSLVGPRPNVKVETDLYTEEEKRLLSVKPGITDISSIVFSDEGEILRGSDNPDLLYNQIIRPWKGKLGLLYIDNRSFMMDIQLIYLTILAILSRESALLGVNKMLSKISDDAELIEVCKRSDIKPPAAPPPGMASIVTER